MSLDLHTVVQQNTLRLQSPVVYGCSLLLSFSMFLMASSKSSYELSGFHRHIFFLSMKVCTLVTYWVFSVLSLLLTLMKNVSSFFCLLLCSNLTHANSRRYNQQGNFLLCVVPLIEMYKPLIVSRGNCLKINI